jgi:hypothetical protein
MRNTAGASMVETKQIIRTFEDSKVVVKTANRRRPNFVMPKTKQKRNKDKQIIV